MVLQSGQKVAASAAAMGLWQMGQSWLGVRLGLASVVFADSIQQSSPTQRPCVLTPLRGYSSLASKPTACVVGYYLTPLPGLCALSSFKNKNGSTDRNLITVAKSGEGCR